VNCYLPCFRLQLICCLLPARYCCRLCLKFTWFPAPPLLSGGEPCRPATVAGFIYLKFVGPQEPGAATPTFSGRLCLFKVSMGDCPSPLLLWRVLQAGYCGRLCLFKICLENCPSHLLWCALGTPPSLLHVLFSSLFIIQYFFSWGRGQTVQEAMLVYPRGAWEYCLLLICSPVGQCLPGRLGACVWWCGSPPDFSV
jgi:hypothetical protein